MNRRFRSLDVMATDAHPWLPIEKQATSLPGLFSDFPDPLYKPMSSTYDKTA